jgi:hypothetical protein
MSEASLTAAERHRLRLYFLDVRGRYALSLLFVGLLLVELRVGQVLLLAGAAWAAAALTVAIGRPADPEIDRLMARDLRSVIAIALDNLNPHHEVQGIPCVVCGPAEPSAQSPWHRFIRPRTGSDGLPRSPLNQALVLVPEADRLTIWSCDRDSLEGVTSRFCTEEYHYGDVVSVRLQEAAVIAARHPQPAGQRKSSDATRRRAQTLSLDFVNGKHLSASTTLTLEEGMPEEATSREARPTSLEKTVLAIQALMRDRR